VQTQTSSLVFLNYLTTVFDTIDEAIMLIGVEPGETYRLLLANQAFTRITGRLEVPIGKPVAQTVSKQAYRLLKDQYRKVVATRQPLTFTDWYEVPLGREAFEVKLIPILNSVGECVQIAAITRSVTELYKLRAENEQLRVQLASERLVN
jgi:hypothetical protein